MSDKQIKLVIEGVAIAVGILKIIVQHKSKTRNIKLWE